MWNFVINFHLLYYPLLSFYLHFILCWLNGTNWKHLPNVPKKVSSFHPDWTNWLQQAVLVSDWLIFKSPISSFTRNIYWRLFTMILWFVPVGLQTRIPQAVLVSDRLILKVFFWNYKAKWNIHLKDLLKLFCFVPIGRQTWLPQAILVSGLQFLKAFSFETTGSNETESLDGSAQRFLVLFQSHYKHSCYRKFLFLIGLSKNILKPVHLTKWTFCDPNKVS